ncbi:MAG: type I restriction endonuclease subunit M [Bacteroidetes bacterium GWF2_42_66]|nr:MAG: type I restriction endonuclease subunit M [Bacteroidetes bacterium GWA2_42_15]OFX98909.1 MAG: type I restriction endonuclease subunit M [Bacteroidetes bacterium GWE2_42_39]OFY45624.1 MAG: type I restriction endonuclease subunit M [Bacteroidetes bacterium GWF2_42_66]HBL77395.1 type I restriction endonuclease subunit M [Prolixibacteraceae bacterium]HCU62441.1 type I restriction endonuclease subunit M [Prolixibacteraceae bacterium]
MAIKKSELYSSIWASCDELRGGMDASQYKDYVLVLLFIKYVSDKYENDPDGIIEIPEGGSFKDMIALKNNKEIGDKMNTIIGELAKANDLVGVIDVADFNDDEKLGKGQEMIDRLTKLIAIFEKPALDFSKNRAGGDDILGDAFEYLMKNFATESGKSKGQFYTPGEVSRVLAKVLGITEPKNSTTFYDPTCGSGSLLLKVIDEADGKGSIYGQEKDVATAALARMNMILHGIEGHEIHRGQSTLSDPFFKDKDGNMRTFDFVVANPPFSSKNWVNGFDPQNDLYGRFEKDEEESQKIGKVIYKTPPEKNGDFAFLLHILKSLKSTGKGACILPHGVLFRGNAEAEIRKSLIQRGYIKGIIGFPANLFFGTGIPACVIILDKEGADTRKHIFLIDASKGFIKDGSKNRLREQDIHKIVDVFTKQTNVPKYSRLVSVEEISDPKNDYNLNIPRYIDSQETEDIQDIEAHLLGGIPNADIEALQEYWDIYPSLKAELFNANGRENYSDLKIDKVLVKQTIFSHPEFTTFIQEMDEVFEGWKTKNTEILKSLAKGLKPKQVVFRISEDVLATYTGKALMDKYDVYQHLMDYWNDVMQDDCYYIAIDGWKAELTITKQTKSITEWDCDLVPKTLVIDRYFLPEKKAIEKLEVEKEAIAVQIAELEENLPDGVEEDDWILNEVKNDKGKITKTLVDEKMRELKIEILKIPNTKAKKEITKIIKDTFDKAKRTNVNAEFFDKLAVLQSYLDLVDKDTQVKAKIKKALADLDKKVIARYKTLTEDEIKQLVVDDKWMTVLERDVKTEMERISQRLTQRINELAERYETTLPKQTTYVAELEEKVITHLQKMGFVWN